MAEAGPRAVVEPFRTSSRVVAVNAAARERGIVPGHPLAAALALEAGLRIDLRSPARERALLERLAAAACVFSPRVNLEPPDAVVVELRGSLALFGGLAALVARLQASCGELGVEASLALAPNPLAALVFARAQVQAMAAGAAARRGSAGSEAAGRGATGSVAAGRLTGALAPLPIALLRWPQSLLERLRSMGVERFGELLRLPRAGLAQRLGPDALADLDRLVGRRSRPARSFSAAARFRIRRDPDYELTDSSGVLQALGPMLQELEHFLRGRQSAITALQVRLGHRRRCDLPLPPSTRLDLRLAAPEFSAEHFHRLLAEQCARLVLPEPVVRCELLSGALQPHAAQSSGLWSGGEHGGLPARESSSFIERLQARLGAQAVHGLCLVAEHRPEYAWRAVEPGAAAASHTPQHGGLHLRRPLWLLTQPEELPAPDALQLIEGPERIETGWWDGRDVARDYYCALDRAGARLWVFREREAPHRWFLQGVFG
jgi:protein ImuB